METPISKPKHDRATTEQLQFYIRFCRERPQLLTGKNIPKSPRQMQELWNELADGLNALRGPTRTTSKWKETLGVWKSQLRTRTRRLKMSQRLTGGGPCSKPLSDFEELALSTLGLAAVEGVTSSGSFGLALAQQPISVMVEDPLLSPGGSMPSSGGSMLSPGGSMPSPGGSMPSPGGSMPSPGGSMPSPECSLPSPSGTQPDELIMENVTYSEGGVLMPKVRPDRLERKKLIDELIQMIKNREEREKQREEHEMQQQMLFQQQQRETLVALQG